MVTANAFKKHCEEGIKLCKELIIKDEIKRIIVVSTGKESAISYLLETFARNNKIPLIVTEDYANPDLINFKTLVIFISKEGNDEEILSNYRLALRSESKIVVFNSGGKLKELYKKNAEVISFEIEKDTDIHLFGAISLFGSLAILKNAELFNDIYNEIDKTLMLIEKVDISKLGNLLAKRIENRMPIIVSSKKNIALTKSWKILFNSLLKKRVILDILPTFMHSTLLTYTEKEQDYTIILRDQDDLRQTKKDIDEIKKSIKKQGHDVIEIALSGKYLLLRILSAYLICVSCIENIKEFEKLELEEY